MDTTNYTNCSFNQSDIKSMFQRWNIVFLCEKASAGNREHFFFISKIISSEFLILILFCLL